MSPCASVVPPQKVGPDDGLGTEAFAPCGGISGLAAVLWPCRSDREKWCEDPFVTANRVSTGWGKAVPLCKDETAGAALERHHLKEGGTVLGAETDVFPMAAGRGCRMPLI